MQAEKLYYETNKAAESRKTCYKKVLQVLPKADRSQRDTVR